MMWSLLSCLLTTHTASFAHPEIRVCCSGILLQSECHLTTSCRALLEIGRTVFTHSKAK